LLDNFLDWFRVAFCYDLAGYRQVSHTCEIAFEELQASDCEAIGERIELAGRGF